MTILLVSLDILKSQIKSPKNQQKELILCLLKDIMSFILCTQDKLKLLQCWVITSLWLFMPVYITACNFLKHLCACTSFCSVHTVP